jgi:CRISPR system Cascade subunit CasE
MFFSLITPARGHEREAAHEWTRGAYAEHQWLWRFLPAPRGTPRSFLFRRHDMDGLPRFYVVSRDAPLPASACWEVRYKPYAPELAAGQWLRFDLRANPVVTTRSIDGQASRHDVVMQEKTRLLKERGLQRWADWSTPDRPALSALVQRCGATWLLSRGERLGVTFDADSVRAEGYEQHRGKADKLRISTIDFRGRLCVHDPQGLQTALFLGVGHAKAFGCGLLLVKPLHELS